MTNDHQLYGRCVRPTSRVKLSLAAQFIRDEIFEAPPGKLDVMRYVEFALPNLMEGFTLEVGSNEEMGPIEGLTFPDERIMRLREDVYFGSLDGDPRARFTVAHELGHLLLHAGHARVASTRPPAPYEDPEWQASAFACEILMPPSEIEYHARIDEVIERYGVSRSAAEVRLKTLRGVKK